jgi:hypothetical protein
MMASITLTRPPVERQAMSYDKQRDYSPARHQGSLGWKCR